MVEIPVLFSVVGGKEQHKLADKIFGKKPHPDKKDWFLRNTEAQIEVDIKISNKGGTIREAEFAFQDLNTLIEIATNYRPNVIDILTGYLASKLIDYVYAKIKMKIGKKDVSNKYEIKQALTEIFMEQEEIKTKYNQMLNELKEILERFDQYRTNPEIKINGEGTKVEEFKNGNITPVKKLRDRLDYFYRKYEKELSQKNDTT